MTTCINLEVIFSLWTLTCPTVELSGYTGESQVVFVFRGEDCQDGNSQIDYKFLKVRDQLSHVLLPHKIHRVPSMFFMYG